MITEQKAKEPFEIEKHLSQPWFSLHLYKDFAFKAEVKPLTWNQLDELVGNLTGGHAERFKYAQWLREENISLLNSNDRVGLVLDGRAKDSTEGFLGDMIEASRMVNVIRSTGKKVIIATPHTDLFEQNGDPDVSIVAIPDTVPASPNPPWDQSLLVYLREAVGNVPFIFPMNAAVPALIQLGQEGTIENSDNISLVKEAFKSNGRNAKVTPQIWGKYGIHQLQAFQITSYLMGIEGSENWQEFPKAFLHPSKNAKEVAKEVIKIYGCFDTYSEECPPIYLHPGVATNGSKLITKFYPEVRWIDFINQLSTARNTGGSLTFLEPTDEQQSAMTLRLATTAIEAGLRVSKVPMASVKEKYEWTLGSFVSFLQELSNHRGIIVGCDSMPAGHAGPAVGNPAVVLGSHCYNPGFYCPSEKALVVLPSKQAYTSSIEPERVVAAVQYLCEDPQLKHPPILQEAV